MSHLKCNISITFGSMQFRAIIFHDKAMWCYSLQRLLIFSVFHLKWGLQHLDLNRKLKLAVTVEKKTEIQVPSILRIHMMVGCAYLLPQFLGTGVCFGHLRCQEKVMLLHGGCSVWLCRLPTAQELLAEVGRRTEILWGFVHPYESSFFFFFNLA